jgi:hypothetical protein
VALPYYAQGFGSMVNIPGSSSPAASGAAAGSVNPYAGSGTPGSASNPSNYNTGPSAAGFGGAGEIAGGGAVPMSGVNLPYFNQQYGQIQGLMAGQSPWTQNTYGGQWSGLIGQLQQQANGAGPGGGPSPAEQAYNQALGNSNAQLSSMAQGSANPDLARQAMLQQGQAAQGQTAGLAQAQTQYQLGSQQALASALGQAGSQSLQQQGMNQQTYMGMLGQQLGLSEAQLKALQGNQGYAQGMAQINAQQNAAKLSALSGMVGGLAKLGG